MRNTFGKKHVDSLKNKKAIFTQLDLDFAKKIFGEIKCISGHNLEEPTKNLSEPNLHFMTFLRDPITRTASHYQDQCIRNNYQKSFQEWAKDNYKHNMQTKMITGCDDVEKAKKKILTDKYFFVGITEKFNDSLKLLKLTCPEPMNYKYMRKLIAQDNSIKNSVIKDPQSLDIIKEMNTLDFELYEYVKNELFPKRLALHEKELNKVILPKERYKNHLTLNYQMSVGFNKFIYRQLIKLLN